MWRPVDKELDGVWLEVENLEIIGVAVTEEAAGYCSGWRVVGDMMFAAMAGEVVLVEKRVRV